MLELNKIYNGDCIDLFKGIDDNSIDLIITSPPYNLGNNHHTRSKKTEVYEDDIPEPEYQDWQIEVLNECYRILKDNGSIFYNHKNRIKNGIQITPYQWILKTKLLVKQEIIWQNGSPNFDKIRFYPFTERIYWLVKDSKTKLYNEINHHDFFSSSEWKPVKTSGEHKRAFPVEMVEDILKCFKESKIILDPFAGSCTVAVGAQNLNRNWICIEKEEKYCEAGLKRINENRMKLGLVNCNIKSDNNITVVNKHKHQSTENDVLIHRGTPLGNPFTHIKDRNTLAEFVVDTREEAINNYEKYINEKIKNKDKIICDELNKIYKMALQDNVNLVCFCKPSSCHGDIIKKIIEDKLK